MDPNTNTQTTIQAPNTGQTPPVPPAPEVGQAPVQDPVSTPPKSKTKLYFMIIAAVLVILAILIGVVLMRNKNQTAQPSASLNQTTDQISGAPQLSDEEKEVDAVVVEDSEKDFTDVNRDLQQL